MSWRDRKHKAAWEAQPREWVVYALCDPRTMAVRYVGISSNAARRHRSHMKQLWRDPRGQWIEALLESGAEPSMYELCRLTGLQTDARRMERHWIEKLRASGCDLLNSAKIRATE